MRGLRTVGLVVCVGLAAGAGGFGLLRYVAADDGWKPSATPVADPAFLPVAATVPFTQPPPPKAPDLKAGLVIPPPVEIAPPTPPAKSAEPVVPPRPVGTENRLQPAAPGHNEKAAEPVVPAVPLPSAFGISAPTLPVEVPLPPEVTPMPLNPRHAVLSAVFGVAALTVTPTVAQDNKDKDKDKPVLKSDFDALKQSVDDSRRDLIKLGESLKKIAEKVEGRDNGTARDGLVDDITKLWTEFNALKSRLEALDKKQTEAMRTIAGKASIEDKPNAGKATIRVVNEYPTQVTMLVNGAPHRVDAATTKDISVPAGYFLYQLLTSGQTEVSSPVKDGEVITLRVK